MATQAITGMTGTINPVSIFLPMLVIVALTFLAVARLAIMRQAAVKAGQDPQFYRAQLGTPEPEATVVAVRHYSNLLELPVLFYAACLSAYGLAAVSGWTLAFAWAFTAARLGQSAVHLTYNTPTHRGLFFVTGVFCLLALWMNVGMAVFGRI
jgi:hypothetical protein